MSVQLREFLNPLAVDLAYIDTALGVHSEEVCGRKLTELVASAPEARQNLATRTVEDFDLGVSGPWHLNLTLLRLLEVDFGVDVERHALDERARGLAARRAELHVRAAVVSCRNMSHPRNALELSMRDMIAPPIPCGFTQAPYEKWSFASKEATSPRSIVTGSNASSNSGARACTSPLGAAIAVVTFVAIALLRVPLQAALPVLALISTGLLWRFRQ